MKKLRILYKDTFKNGDKLPADSVNITHVGQIFEYQEQGGLIRIEVDGMYHFFGIAEEGKSFEYTDDLLIWTKHLYIDDISELMITELRKLTRVSSTIFAEVYVGQFPVFYLSIEPGTSTRYLIQVHDEKGILPNEPTFECEGDLLWKDAEKAITTALQPGVKDFLKLLNSLIKAESE